MCHLYTLNCTHLNYTALWVRWLGRQEKRFADGLLNLTSIPGFHTVEGENLTSSLSSDFHTRSMAHTLSTPKINECKNTLKCVYPRN